MIPTPLNDLVMPMQQKDKNDIYTDKMANEYIKNVYQLMHRTALNPHVVLISAG